MPCPIITNYKLHTYIVIHLLYVPSTTRNGCWPLVPAVPRGDGLAGKPCPPGRPLRLPRPLDQGRQQQSREQSLFKFKRVYLFLKVLALTIISSNLFFLVFYAIFSDAGASLYLDVGASL